MTQARSCTLAERYEQGVSLRQRTPREKHAELLGPSDRDPVAILAASDRTRIPELIPVRYERMLSGPFAFLRGAAAVMAQDLRHQPSVGVAVQACGDPAVLAGYMGKSDTFDDALASFAMAYADRTQRDYHQLAKSKRGTAKRR